MAAASVISGILGILPGVAESIVGVEQQKEAQRREAKLGAAPEFEIPQSQLDYEGLMQTRARQEMPGYSTMQQNIEAQTAQASSAASRVAGTQAGALAGVNRAQADRRKYLRQLGISGETYRSGAQSAATQATMSRAPYEQMQFEYNEWLPWQIAKNEIASLRGMGQAQLMSGLDQAAAAGIYGTNMIAQQQYYNQYQQQPMATQPSSYQFSPQFQSEMSNLAAQQQSQWRNPYPY